MSANSEPHGEIIATSTSEITGQCWQGSSPFAYGSFVAAGKETPCIGVVYNVETTSIDPTRRPTAIQKPEEEIERWYPNFKMLLRNQFQALLVGSLRKGRFQYGLPATPPALHVQVRPCTPDEINQIRQQPDFFRILYSSGKSSTEELILNCCQHLLHNFEPNQNAVPIGKALSDLYRDDYDTLRRMIHRLETWLNN